VWIYRPDLDEGELPLSHIATPVFAEAEAGEVLE
jgi:hypothetical protein